MSAGLIIGLALVALLMLSAPLFVVIGVLTCLGYVVTGEAESWMDVALIERVRELTDKPPLLAIPFFVLSGVVMSRGAIATRLVDVARAAFSGVPGGLGIATVAACMFFAAISGSSPVTVITIGGVMYPALIKMGYPDRFATGLVTSAGTLGILIPPSIPMIVYAIFASSSSVIQVEDLFLAGMGPGLLIGLLLGLYCLMVGAKKGERFQKTDFGALRKAIGEGFWALMLPVVILGGIYTGFFTATEAAAISVVYSFVVEVYIHRQLKLEEIPDVVAEAAVLMGSLLVIFAMAVGLNGLLSDLEVPVLAANWMAGLDLTPITFMLILNGFLLIVGCLMDIMSAIMILVPLLAPLAEQMGIDPIHLGIVFIVNLELGYLTPPMGLNLFVSSSLFDKSIGEVIRSVLPFTGIMMISVLLVTFVPTISLGPVNLLQGRDFYVPFPTEAPVTTSVEEESENAPSSDSPAKGKSLGDLMKESGGFDDDDDGDWDDDDDDWDDDDEPDKPKSLQELMKESGGFDDLDDEDL